MTEHPFDYAEAFTCNQGLVSTDEQIILQKAKVAIAGVGGVGASHLLTLTRLGIGQFTISDPDTFELRNFNRQAGATMQTIGRPKVDVMAEMARAINPELNILTSIKGVNPSNIREFLNGSDVVIDGLDFFEIEARRMLFREARACGLNVVTCGPLGFGVALLVFGPQGPSFDEFMAIDDSQDELEKLLRFAVGLAPAGLHIPYIDAKQINLKEHRGPSSMTAINLCAAVASSEVLRILLRRESPLCVPRYAQFDPYRRLYRTGTLWWGNRNPIQQLKLWYIKNRLLRIVSKR